MIPYLACMITVASITHLPPRVLPAIQAVEGGRPGLVHPDSNGTADLGVMQVNTIWIPALAARANMTAQNTEKHLINDPCFNIAAAALILRTYLAQTHGALLPAIGDYHSHSPLLNHSYSLQTEQAARALFGGEQK